MTYRTRRAWRTPMTGVSVFGAVAATAILFGAFSGEAQGQDGRKSDVPEGAQAYKAPDESYLCAPSSAGAKAFFREMSKSIETKREAVAEVEATRADLDALKKEIVVETLKLKAAIAEWDARQADAKEAAKIDEAKTAAKEAVETNKQEALSEAKLAKALSKMPAMNAANVFAGLDGAMAARLIKQMPPQKAGATLAAMPPSKAAALTAMAIKETP